MLPPVLINYANKLSGFSTNVVRLEVQGSKTVGPNQQVRVTLPSNAILNMKSFAVHAVASATATNSKYARLPPAAVSLFDRVEVAVGGTQLSAGCASLNVYHAAKRALMGAKTPMHLTNAHGDLFRNISYVTGQGVSQTDASHITAQGFGGLLDSEVVLDSSLVGDITVTLHTAPANIISVSNNVDSTANFQIHTTTLGTANYELSGLYCTIEVFAISDPAYDTLSKRIIAEKGYLQIDYKNIHSSIQTHNGASRFNIAFQSLDRIWCTFRDPAVVSGNLPALRKTGYGVIANHPRIGGVEEYVPAAFRFSRLNGGDVRMQFSLNGALWPQYAATIQDWAHAREPCVSPRPTSSRHA